MRKSKMMRNKWRKKKSKTTIDRKKNEIKEIHNTLLERQFIEFTDLFCGTVCVCAMLGWCGVVVCMC